MMKRGIWKIVGVVGMVACSGSTIDVGPMGGGSGGTPEGSAAGAGPAAGGATSQGGGLTCTDTSPLPDWPSSTACAGSSDSPVVGKWAGYIESEGGTWDQLLLEIKGANSSGLCGTLTVGDAPAPLPATDPGQSYYPATPDGGWTFIPGYASTLLEGRIDGMRLRFGLGPTEGYRSWCALQPSYAQILPYTGSAGYSGAPTGFASRAGGVCSCVPTGQTTSIDDSSDHCSYSTSGVVTSCIQGYQCGSGLCACNASGCDAAPKNIDRFDLTVSGDTIEGSDSYHEGKRIHFTRVP